MKKLLTIMLALAPVLAFSQIKYDSVRVVKPQNFVEAMSIDTAIVQIISQKAGVNRRVNFQTAADWILAQQPNLDSAQYANDTLLLFYGPDTILAVIPSGTIDTAYLSGDTLGIVFAGDATEVVLAGLGDGNGLFSASNDNDTIRVSTALLRAAFQISGRNHGTTISANNSSAVALTVQNTDASGNSFSAIATNGIAISGTSSGNSAALFQSTSGYGMLAVVNPSSTSSMVDVISLRRTTSGTSSVGLGAGINFTGQTISSISNMGTLGYRWTNVTSAGRSSSFQVDVVDSITQKTRFFISPKGQLTLSGYAANALNNADSSLYVLAVDATGDVHSVPKDSLGGGVADNIYTSDGTLTGDRVINSDGYLLIDFGGFFAVADSAWYAAQGILGAIPSGISYGISNVGLSFPYQLFPGINAILSPVNYSTATAYYDETFYAALVAKDGADSSRVIVGDADIRLYADTLDATGVTTFLGFPSGGAIDSISYYGDTLRIYEGGDLTPFKAEIVAGADTDDQTLSTSRDTITIADGNSVRTPGVGFLRDSITGATKTLDLKKYSQAIYVIKMESATSVTLTINNPWSEVSGSYPTQEGETGVYTFRFAGISGTDNVTWPANFYDMGGTALGTDVLTAGTAYTCFYDPVEAKYYCK